jgi:hypothetical protein
MTAAREISSKHLINILQDFQVFLRGIWKSDGKRDWTIYTDDHQSEFWNTRDIVDRSK